jgi:hypothetical protein
VTPDGVDKKVVMKLEDSDIEENRGKILLSHPGDKYPRV